MKHTFNLSLLQRVQYFPPYNGKKFQDFIIGFWFPRLTRTEVTRIL